MSRIGIEFWIRKEVSAMAEAVKSRSRRRKSGEEEVERQQLLEGMEQTRIQLNQAYAEFNAHSDPELVESCVFAINALRSLPGVKEISLMVSTSGSTL